jgi:hypothetical protein
MSVKLTSLLRDKVRFSLVDGVTELIEPAMYPFGSSRIPILSESPIEEPNPNEAYESGFRSIYQLRSKFWLKAKGVGIAHGDSKPVQIDSDIYTYFLNEEKIGYRKLIWGFSTIEEARKELEMAGEARRNGCPAPTPIGLGVYGEVCARVTTFKGYSKKIIKIP